MIRLLTSSLIMVLGIWMGAGIVNILIQLKDEFTSAWVSIVEHTIANGLIMLALLAVIRTLQAYLTLGRVRVTLYSRYRTGGADRRADGIVVPGVRAAKGAARPGRDCGAGDPAPADGTFSAQAPRSALRFLIRTRGQDWHGHMRALVSRP